MSTRNTTESKTDLVTYHVLVFLKKHLHQDYYKHPFTIQPSLVAGELSFCRVRPGGWKEQAMSEVFIATSSINGRFSSHVWLPEGMSILYVYKTTQHRGNIVGTIRFFLDIWAWIKYNPTTVSIFLGITIYSEWDLLNKKTQLDGNTSHQWTIWCIFWGEEMMQYPRSTHDSWEHIHILRWDDLVIFNIGTIKWIPYPYFPFMNFPTKTSHGSSHLAIFDSMTWRKSHMHLGKLQYFTNLN